MTPALREDLAARVADYIGRPGDPATIRQAAAHVDVVAEFVHGYVGSGWYGVDGNPAPGLRAVIVSATARLTTNPEQVATYTAADYSERPTTLTGWTIAEQSVLHRYRTRWA